MMNLRALTAQIGTAAIVAALPALARAESRLVAPDEGRLLQAVIDAATPGDVITLQAGEYKGPITIDKALSLVGQGQVSVVGNGKGSVITITAEGVTVRRLQVSGSGTDLAKLDLGVFAAKPPSAP